MFFNNLSLKDNEDIRQLYARLEKGGGKGPHRRETLQAKKNRPVLEKIQRPWAGRNLTREGLVAAEETLKDFDADIIAPMTYTNAKHYGASTHYPAVVRDVGGAICVSYPSAPI